MKRLSPSLLVSVLMSAAAVPACSGGVSVSSEGSVATGGSSVGVAFADVAAAASAVAAEPDVVVASGKRGEVDVLTREDATSWRVFGNLLLRRRNGAGRGRPRRRRRHRHRAQHRRRGRAHADAGGHVASPRLPGINLSLRPQQARPPIRRRRRPASRSAISTATARAKRSSRRPGLGIVVLPAALAAAPTVNPEHPPTINGFKLAAGPAPSRGRGHRRRRRRPRRRRRARRRRPTLAHARDDAQLPLDIQPSLNADATGDGRVAARDRLRGAPLVVTLVDGSLVAVTRTGRSSRSSTRWRRCITSPLPATRSSSTAVHGLSLFDSCATSGAPSGRIAWRRRADARQRRQVARARGAAARRPTPSRSISCADPFARIRRIVCSMRLVAAVAVLASASIACGATVKPDPAAVAAAPVPFPYEEWDALLRSTSTTKGASTTTPKSTRGRQAREAVRRRRRLRPEEARPTSTRPKAREKAYYLDAYNVLRVEERAHAPAQAQERRQREDVVLLLHQVRRRRQRDEPRTISRTSRAPAVQGRARALGAQLRVGRLPAAAARSVHARRSSTSSCRARRAKFCNEKRNVDFDAATKKLKLSHIFDWYKDDFGKEPAKVIAWINHYREARKLPADAKIEYVDYDWTLNDLHLLNR